MASRAPAGDLELGTWVVVFAALVGAASRLALEDGIMGYLIGFTVDSKKFK